jgi:hypothetical protein
MQSKLTTMVNSPTAPLVSFQMSFTTADVERQTFHGAITPYQETSALPGGTVLLINGEFFRLDEQNAPAGLPLPEGAGVFGLVGLDELQA